MSRGFGFIATILVVAIGGYIYTRQAQTLTPIGAAPNTMIDVTAVHNDLVAMANAERRYQVMNAKYASLEELRENGDIHIPTRPSYRYSIDASDSAFKIIATYTGADPKAPKHISVDETMVVQNR